MQGKKILYIFFYIMCRNIWCQSFILFYYFILKKILIIKNFVNFFFIFMAYGVIFISFISFLIFYSQPDGGSCYPFSNSICWSTKARFISPCEPSNYYSILPGEKSKLASPISKGSYVYLNKLDSIQAFFSLLQSHYRVIELRRKTSHFS